MFATLLAAATAASSFSVSDTTDNSTGEREVYALQMAQERSNLGFLYLQCDAGSPRLMLDLYDVPKTEWAMVTIDTADSETPTPLNFRRADDVMKRLAYQGDSEELIRRLAGNQLVAFTAHYDYREFTFTFSMDGIAPAWEKVTKYCLRPDE